MFSGSWKRARNCLSRLPQKSLEPAAALVVLDIRDTPAPQLHPYRAGDHANVAHGTIQNEGAVGLGLHRGNVDLHTGGSQTIAVLAAAVEKAGGASFDAEI